MQEENEYPQEEVVVEEENTTTEEVNEDSNDDTVTLSKSEYSKLKRQAIAYKANKSEKPEVKETQNTTNSFSEVDIEAKILKSQGESDELIEEMKALAVLRKKSLLEMRSDPLIVAIKEAREAESKAKQARLGVSRGSTSVKPTRSTLTPGLSDEEHKALWREANNK